MGAISISRGFSLVSMGWPLLPQWVSCVPLLVFVGSLVSVGLPPPISVTFSHSPWSSPHLCDVHPIFVSLSCPCPSVTRDHSQARGEGLSVPMGLSPSLWGLWVPSCPVFKVLCSSLWSAPMSQWDCLSFPWAFPCPCPWGLCGSWPTPVCPDGCLTVPLHISSSL